MIKFQTTSLTSKSQIEQANPHFDLDPLAEESPIESETEESNEEEDSEIKSE
jgi:hypothetical protein